MPTLDALILGNFTNVVETVVTKEAGYELINQWLKADLITDSAHLIFMADIEKSSLPDTLTDLEDVLAEQGHPLNLTMIRDRATVAREFDKKLDVQLDETVLHSGNYLKN